MPIYCSTIMRTGWRRVALLSSRFESVPSTVPAGKLINLSAALQTALGLNSLAWSSKRI